MKRSGHALTALAAAAAQWIGVVCDSPASDSATPAAEEAGLPAPAGHPLSDREPGVTLPVTVGDASLRLLLDTGSLAHFFDNGHVEKLGPRIGTARSATPTGSRLSPVHRLPAGSRCGPCDLSGQEAGLFDASIMSGDGRGGPDGTLGLNAMRGHLWDFDFDRGWLSIVRSPAGAEAATPVPAGSLLNLPVTLPDGRTLPFLLDTGCLAWGTLEEGVFDALLGSGHLTRLPDAEISTAQAASRAAAQGRLDTLRFQEESLPPAVFLRGNANRLGWGFFIRYNWRISLDTACVTATPRRPAATVADPPETEGPEALVDGPLLYQRACMSCHMADGAGREGIFPPLRGSDWVAAHDPARLIRITLHGMTGPLSVNGKPFRGSAPFMPGHAATLTDNEVAGLLTWIRREMADQHAAVPPGAVTRIRQAEAGRTRMWRERELLAIPLDPPPTPP